MVNDIGERYERVAWIVQSDNHHIQRLFTNRSKTWMYLMEWYMDVTRGTSGDKPINNYTAFCRELKLLDKVFLNVTHKKSQLVSHVWITKFVIN